MLRQFPPPLGIHTTCTNYNNLISKKSKRFFYTRVKYNHTCMKEVNLMPSKRFSDISKFQNFVVKNEKNQFFQGGSNPPPGEEIFYR